jgi:hypothetical protein
MICGCNDADELGELVHVVGSAHHRKHAGQVIDVAPHPVVRIEEYLHMPRRALDRIRMSEQRCTQGMNLVNWSSSDRHTAAYM